MMTSHADTAAVLDAVLGRLDDAMSRRDAEAAAALFEEDGYWRDLVIFTWNLCTLEGRTAIAAMLSSQLDHLGTATFTRDPDEPCTTHADGVLEGWFHIETRTGRGYGHIRIRDGRIWTLLTTLSELKGHEEPSGPRRPQGTEHGIHRQRQSWLEKRQQEEAELGHTVQPHVLIIGGGQGGIALGARLRQLSVPTIIIEKNARPGDSWRKRYKTLCLHDPV